MVSLHLFKNIGKADHDGALTGNPQFNTVSNWCQGCGPSAGLMESSACRDLGSNIGPSSTKRRIATVVALIGVSWWAIGWPEPGLGTWRSPTRSTRAHRGRRRLPAGRRGRRERAIQAAGGENHCRAAHGPAAARRVSGPNHGVCAGRIRRASTPVLSVPAEGLTRFDLKGQLTTAVRMAATGIEEACCACVRARRDGRDAPLDGQPRAVRVRPAVGSADHLAATTAWVAWLVPATRRSAMTHGARRRSAESRASVLSPMASDGLALPSSSAGRRSEDTNGCRSRSSSRCSASCRRLFAAGPVVMIGICALYLPLLGTTSLWDPWETHYGEVAREILARNDWISLWWAQDKWFWSKPVLLFWMEALSMGFLGVDFMPDANPAHPEWALRLPALLMALAALAAIYRRFGATSVRAQAPSPPWSSPRCRSSSSSRIKRSPTCRWWPRSRSRPAACSWRCKMESARRPCFRSGAGGLVPAPGAVCDRAARSSAGGLSDLAQHLVGRGLRPGRPPRPLSLRVGRQSRHPWKPEPARPDPTPSGIGGQPFVQGILWLAVLAGLALILRRERRCGRS